MRNQTFLQKRRKKYSPAKYGANGNKQSFLTLLQGTFRRSAAESTSCKSIVLLLDEPVSGLDPKATAEMYDIIEELNRRDKITIIMISHDISAAVKYASHILHIGDEIFFGTKEEYLKSNAGGQFTGNERSNEN